MAIITGWDVGVRMAKGAAMRCRMDERAHQPHLAGSRWDVRSHVWVTVAGMRHWDAGKHSR